MKSKASLLSVLLCIGLMIFLSSCQAAPSPEVTSTLAPTSIPATEIPTETATPIPPTETPVPLPSATDVPMLFSASEQPIKIMGYSIRITYNGLLDSYNPCGTSTTTALNFGVTEDSGKLDELIAMGLFIADSQGNSCDGCCFSETDADKTFLVFNILTTEAVGEYFLRFPSGEMIDLTPLIQNGEIITLAPITQNSTPTSPGNHPVFAYPKNQQILDYGGEYLFKVQPYPGAEGYLWGFFQNGVMVWENFRDEGSLSSNEYGILTGSAGYAKIKPGEVEIWVRAFVGGEYTEAEVITIRIRKP